MSETAVRLLIPDDCALLLIDQQAGLAFGVGSIDRQVLLNNVIALTKTARAFGLPIVISTSATKVYSGPVMPAVQTALPGVVSIERRNMNVWKTRGPQCDRQNGPAASDRVRSAKGGLCSVLGAVGHSGGIRSLRSRRRLRRVDSCQL
jgi:hypothetical protein